MVAGVSSDRSASSSLQVIRSTSFLIAIEYDENKCNKASLELHPTRTYVSRALAVGRSMQRSGSTVDSVLHPEEGGRVLVSFRPKPSVRPSCDGVSSCRFRIRSRVDALSTAERYIDRARWATLRVAFSGYATSYSPVREWFYQVLIESITRPFAIGRPTVTIEATGTLETETVAGRSATVLSPRKRS